MHYHMGELSIVRDASEMTRVQKIVLQKADEYWAEKTKKEQRRTSPGPNDFNL